MIIKHKAINIDENNIFQNDKLDRKEAIENLSSLIVSTNDAFTLSINADWGSGKTTFIKLWQAYMKKELDVQSIYFSAWEDDFSKEPLISILGELNNYISSNFLADPDFEEKFEKVKNVGGKILKRGVPAFLKGVTAGIVDFDQGFEAAIGAIAESSAKELIENYAKDKAITVEFASVIQELLSKIDDTKPFVIFIDELDRCRPTYAIELLERIKHIFGIDGLVFVLGVDKKQLAESIKSHYGNIDTDNYLKRFIDMEYNLKNPTVDSFCHYLYQDVYHVTTLLQNKQIKKESRPDLDELAMIKYLVKVTGMSLREIEQTFVQLSIIFKTIEPEFLEIHFRIIALFIILKMKFSEQYELLIRNELNEGKLIDLLINKNVADIGRINLRTFIRSIILATAKSEVELQKIIQEQKSILAQITDEKEEYNEQLLLIHLLEQGSGRYKDYMLNDAVNAVIKKVEFLESFNLDGISI